MCPGKFVTRRSVNCINGVHILKHKFFHSFCILSVDKSKASSKTENINNSKIHFVHNRNKLRFNYEHVLVIEG